MFAFSLKKILLSTAFFALIISSSFASKEVSIESETYNPVPSIMHHISDSHEWHLWGEGDQSFTIALPIILYSNSFHFFMSSAFRHDENAKHVVTNKESKFVNLHGKIYELDSGETELVFDQEHQLLNASIPLDFSITKSVVSIIFVSILMLLLFRNLAKSYKKNGLISSGIGRFFEPLIVYIRDEIAIPNIGVKHYKRFMSFLLTIFFFVWFCNVLGLTPLGVNVTGNIAITFCLALLTFIITTVSGTKDYWMHIFWMPGMPLPMKIIMAPIELLGVFIKPFTLMIRLYANILAGHIVMMTLISMIFLFRNFIGSGLSFLLAFFISIIEILVALLQAYIFTILSALYFGFAVEEHDH